MTRVFSFLLLLSNFIANCQEIKLDSLTYNNNQYKNSSKFATFDLGKIQQSVNPEQKFLLHITNNSDSYIIIESFATGDDLVGNTTKEPILPSKSSVIPFSFLINHVGKRNQSITIRYKNPKKEGLLPFIVKYEVIENSLNFRPKKPEATTVSIKDIENADNPKYNFKKNAKNNVFIVFVSELKSYDLNKEDLEFQQKYNVKYSLVGSLKMDYLVKYNKLTFKHLKKKYKKDWQTEIRKDAIGITKE